MAGTQGVEIASGARTMTARPAYFHTIRKKAAKRWEQLEGDPELAGPWHQLFMQVQIPRHVVSELLQNADDVAATEASIDLENGEFVFAHDGEDFVEDHFSSLCGFGYSNKRLLHTIGFRGVGFKSTFSLGDEVRLATPTLSVVFKAQRFTEPIWVDGPAHAPDRTEVRVKIKDEHRRKELERNLEEWLKSPASLLFFKHIRRLRIGEHEVNWASQGPGPIANSEWMTLSTLPKERYLLLRSGEEKFPIEALEEIRRERMVSVEEETVFPPCRVEIVLGTEARLFVILPTELKTALPFACNAPFVQDPARIKIKDPESSPTNRWLLKRAGELAAEGLLAWLNRADLSIEQRCGAYAMFPDVDREDASLEGRCATIVEEAFDEAISNKSYLLTEQGELVKPEGCFALPSVVLDIWSTEQVAALFDPKARPVLCRHIARSNRSKLVRRGCVEELNKENIINVLASTHLPRPGTWPQLLDLWAYVSNHVTGYNTWPHYTNVRIVPVQGKEVLFAARETIRLGEKKLLQSQGDWEFLAKHLLVLNQNWPCFLALQRRQAKDHEDTHLGKRAQAAHAVLTTLNLDEASDVSRVIQQVAGRFFSQDKCSLEDCVRLAQLAATLSASVGMSFRFVTRDGYRKPVDEQVVVDQDGDLRAFVDSEWFEKHALHLAYSEHNMSCSEAEWQRWTSSGRSGLLTFVPLMQTQSCVEGRSEIRNLTIRTRL